jgi:tRNA threonylcarbamoyladenosine biosynthesis protein TsaE
MTPSLPHTGSCFLADEAATLAFGERLARQISSPAVIYLRGQLGAGKTTFSRGFLRGRGHLGSVKSPTYTLVEPYEEVSGGPVFHLDLYRLGEGQELAYLGLDDYLAARGVLLIEWPERAERELPAPTIDLTLLQQAAGRTLQLMSVEASALAALPYDLA